MTRLFLAPLGEEQAITHTQDNNGGEEGGDVGGPAVTPGCVRIKAGSRRDSVLSPLRCQGRAFLVVGRLPRFPAAPRRSLSLFFCPPSNALSFITPRQKNRDVTDRRRENRRWTVEDSPVLSQPREDLEGSQAFPLANPFLRYSRGVSTLCRLAEKFTGPDCPCRRYRGADHSRHPLDRRP